MVPRSIDDIFTHICNSLRKQGEIENIYELFSKQTKNSDRVKITTDLLKQNDLLPDKLLQNKSLEKSLQLRNSGNKAFLKKDDIGALLLYTKSIAEAPFPKNLDENLGDALAIALANRSAVLFSMKKYELCLGDILQALKYNYPNNLLYKLYERQGKCLQYVGRNKEAKESLDNALKWLSTATGLTQDKMQTIEAQLQKVLKCLQNAETSVKLPSYQLPELPTCSYNKNHEIPCASDCVELKYCPKMGRYISATRDIQPGDVLAVEKPFTSVLLSDSFKTHCYNCLQHCEALLPCCFCSNVMYCNEECRSSSWNKNHFIDCFLLPILQKLEISKISFLALKIVIIACKTNDLKNMLASLEAEENLEERNRGFNIKGQYSSSDYGPIYWLVGNTEKRAVDDLFRRSVTAACILHCLETMTDFFYDTYINQFKYEIGGLLLQHLQNLPCNAHEVSELVRTNANPIEEGVSLWESVEIGAAAYAMLSLVNHSCDPNVVRHSHRGDVAVLRAIRPIAAGDQVLDNYGFHHALHGKAERLSHLESQYYFTCKCNACSEDWPIYSLLPSTYPTFICNRCKYVLPTRVAELMEKETASCINCNKIHNLAKTWKKIEMSSEDFSRNLEQVIVGEDTDWNEVAQKMIHHLLLLDKNIQRPWKEYNDCQEAIKQCFAMTANCHKP